MTTFPTGRVAAIAASLALTAPMLAAPALAQSVGEKTGVNALPGVSPTTADVVKEAAISDMFELQSSQFAQERADDPTKAFARQMIADHGQASGELKGMVQAGTA